MRKVLSAVLAIALVVIFINGVMAAGEEAKTKAKAEKPGGVVVEAVSKTFTVDAIDGAKRMVTLKSVDGKTQTYKLGPEVKNFDQIKIGDTVKATYLESVAIFVRKSNEKPDAAQVQTVQVAPKGAKPGVIATETIEVTAKVEAIDYKKRTVSLKGPEGNVRTFSVDKSVKKFDNVKVGDEVVLKVTEAMAIAVEKP
jgi:hypothetical protein